MFGGSNALAATGARRFQIIREGDVIGDHSLTLKSRGGEQEMRININIEVRVLGIRAFVYEHTNVEKWRGGQLIALSSRTNDDGDKEFCRVRRSGKSLVVEGSGYSGKLPLDAAPTSYWRKIDTPWFSSQSGKLLKLNISKKRANGGERWRVKGEFNVSLDYDSRGEWRGCSFPGSDGSVISYRQTSAGPRFNS